MLDELCVNDVYIQLDDYPNISLDAPIGHAFHMMHRVLEDKTKFRTLLVMDDDDHLKGYLSIRGLIRAVGPDYLHKKRPVRDHMTLMEDQVSLDDPIAKCLYLLLFRDVLVLPVVENDELIGVVRLVDLFELIANNVEKAWMPKQSQR